MAEANGRANFGPPGPAGAAKKKRLGPGQAGPLKKNATNKTMSDKLTVVHQVRNTPLTSMLTDHMWLILTVPHYTFHKAGMVHSVSVCMRGVQLKLWDPLRTRTIPEHLRGVMTTSRYTNPRLPLPLPLHRIINSFVSYSTNSRWIVLTDIWVLSKTFIRSISWTNAMCLGKLLCSFQTPCSHCHNLHVCIVCISTINARSGPTGTCWLAVPV